MTIANGNQIIRILQRSKRSRIRPVSCLDVSREAEVVSIQGQRRTWIYSGLPRSREPLFVRLGILSRPGEPFRQWVIQVRSVLDLGQQVGTGSNGETEGLSFTELEHRKGLGHALPILRLDFGLPEAQRLSRGLVKMHSCHAAYIVRTLLLMEIAHRERLDCHQLLVAPSDGLRFGCLGAAAGQVVEGLGVVLSTSTEAHAPAPRFDGGLMATDGIHESCILTESSRKAGLPQPGIFDFDSSGDGSISWMVSLKVGANGTAVCAVMRIQF